MGNLLANDWFIGITVAACVFLICYFNIERLIQFIQRRSLGTRQEIIELMNKMLFDVDKEKLTMTLILMSVGVGFIFFLVLWPNIVAGVLIGGAVTVLGWSLPKTYMIGLWNKRCARLVNQMVDGMTIMSNSVKAGLTITQGMERVVDNMSGPLPQEFNLVLSKVRLGMSVEEALNEFGDRIPMQDVQMFVTAVNILSESGGNLAETFETIVTTIRERQKVEKKIEAMTSQGIWQGIIITLVPFILMLVFIVVDPNYIMPLFTQPLGWFALFLMLGLQVLGGVLMKKIVTIKV